MAGTFDPLFNLMGGYANQLAHTDLGNRKTFPGVGNQKRWNNGQSKWQLNSKCRTSSSGGIDFYLSAQPVQVGLPTSIPTPRPETLLSFSAVETPGMKMSSCFS